MKFKNEQFYKIISLIAMIVIGGGLYLIIENGFHWDTTENQPQAISSTNESDPNGQHLKMIKHNQEKFATKSMEKQDQILQETNRIKVSKNEIAKKKKVTDAMETTLDKKIIGDISRLQNDADPLDKADALNQKIQKLKSLSSQAKAQFGQEIQGIKQTVQTTN